MTGSPWSERETQELVEAYKRKQEGITSYKFSEEYAQKHPGRSHAAIKLKLTSLGFSPKVVIKDSPYPIYNKPLEMSGDAVVMSDIEFPFHHSDFVNRVLELANAWGIKKAILAGDVLHFDSLSGWEPNWIEGDDGGILAEAIERLQDVASSFRMKERVALLEAISGIGEKPVDDGVSTELAVARDALRRLSQEFTEIDFVIGNHEGRLLRALECAISPKELLRLLDLQNDKRWRIAPYYFSFLYSGDQKYIIEHPKNSGKFSAHKLASKHQAHILMGHNHQFSDSFDVSGKFRAIEIGHCVDELRLPYAAQRHNTSPSHIMGACIVRNGYAWPLHKFTDWQTMKKLV